MSRILLAIAASAVLAGSAQAEGACPKLSKAQSQDVANHYIADVLAGVIVEGNTPATKLTVEREGMKKQVDLLIAAGCWEPEADKLVRKAVRDRMGNASLLPPAD